MAAGSHAENGICALLVIAATIIKPATQSLKVTPEESAQILKLKSPRKVNQAIESRMHTSPTRLERTVTIPALLDFFEG